jgi:hypothetical protein
VVLNPRPPGGADSGADTGSELQPLSVSLTTTEAFDPLRGGRAEILADFSVGATARVSVVDESDQEVALLVESLTDGESFTWGGEDDSGALLAAGAYTVRATAERDGESAVADGSIHSVRLAAAAGTLGGDRLALTWHDADGRGGYWSAAPSTETFRLSALEEDGQALGVPTPWDDLNVPPDEEALDVNWPAAYPYDAVPTLTVELDGDLAGYSGTLSAEMAGWALTDGVVEPGGSLTFTRESAVALGPAVVEEDAELQLLVGEALVMQQAVPLRMYALLGAQNFERSGDAYGHWLAAIDPALRTLDGIEPTNTALLDGLVEFIFDDLGLRYDTQYGASAYVSYRGGSWTRAHFDFSSFLDRRNGSVINCTDAAAILGAYTNMLGGDLSYLILNPGFNLNYILAIGGSEFTSCPFGGDRCGFSYHAVTSPDGGDSIYDATLAIDGDGDPKNTPNTEVLVQGISGPDYKAAIVRDGSPDYHSESKGTIQ